MRKKTKDSRTRILEACAAMLRKGKRPTERAVRAALVVKYGSGPSSRDIGPTLRDWKAKHRDTKAVERAVQAYKRLNAEERKAFRDRVTLMPSPRT